MAVDSTIVIVADVIIIIIISSSSSSSSSSNLVFTNFLIWSQVYFLVLDKYYFIYLISRLQHAGTVKLRLPTVSIILLLRTKMATRNVVTMITCSPWNPAAMKKVEP